MVKTMINTLIKCDKEMVVTLSNGRVFKIPQECKLFQRRIIFRDYVFTKENMNDFISVVIRVIDKDTERVCSFLMCEDAIILMDKGATEKSLCTCSECGEVSELLPNESIEEFEDIFGKVDCEGIRRAKEIMGENEDKSKDDDEDDEEFELMITVAEYETLQSVIEKISKVKEKVNDFLAMEVMIFTERDNNLLCRFSEKDNEESIREGLENSFEALTVKDLEKRILVIIELYYKKDGEVIEKECNIGVNHKTISLYGKSIIRKVIELAYREYTELTKDEIDAEIDDILREVPEEFENIFGKFEKGIVTEKVEEDEDGEWIII